LFGVEAASREYFHSSAATLDVSDAALLAAVLPNPRALRASSPSDYVRERQSWIAAQVRLLESRGHFRGLDW
jgi:monofunctional biosynthetic peptidoglycan transglycosylase